MGPLLCVLIQFWTVPSVDGIQPFSRLYRERKVDRCPAWVFYQWSTRPTPTSVMGRTLWISALTAKEVQWQA